MQPNNNNPDRAKAPQTSNIRWGRIIVATIAAIILTIAIAITWIINDTDRVRSIVEQVVTTLTDRPFHIRGDFDFKLGSEITVYATDIEWINAPWSSQPTMLTVDNAEASVSLQSLFNPPIVITNAVGSGARLDFEWSPDKVSNWYLVKPGRPPREGPRNPLPLLLDKADLRDVELRFKHPALTEELVIFIEKAAQQQDEENLLVPEIDALVDGRKFDIDGRIGPFPELVIAGAVQFDISVIGPSAQTKLAGNLDNLAKLEGPDIDFSFDAPEFAEVLEVLNLPEITSGAAELKGELASDGDTIEGSIKGSVGEFNLDGELQVANLKQLDGVKARLNSDGPNAKAAFNTIGISGLPGEPYALSVAAEDTPQGLQIKTFAFEVADATANGSGLIRDFPILANLDLDLEIDVQDIARFSELLPGNDIPSAPLSFNASIKSNAEGTSDKLTAKALLGKIDAQVSGLITEDTQFAGSTFDFATVIPNVRSLGSILGLNLTRDESANAAGKVRIADATIDIDLAQLEIGAHRLQGNIRLPMGEAAAKLNFSAAAKGGDLSNIVGLFVENDRIPIMPYDLQGTFSLANQRFGLDTVTGTIGGNNLSVSGNLRLDRRTPDIDLDIAVDGSNLGEALQTQGITGVPPEAYSLETSLAVSADAVSLSNIKFNTSDDSLTGSLTLQSPDEALLANFDLTATGADLRSIAPDIPGYEPAAVPFKVRTKGKLENERVDIAELSAQLGDANVTLEGNLDLPPEVKATDISFSAKGPSLRDMGALDVWKFSDVPFAASATMGGTANTLNITDFTAVIGPSDVSGKFQLILDELPQVKLSLFSNLLDIRPLQARLREETDVDEPTEEALEEAIEKDSDRLIPAGNIPTELLESVNATVDIDIRKLLSKRADLGELVLEGTLQDGALDLRRFSARTPKGYLEGKVKLYPENSSSRLEVDAVAKNLVIAVSELDDELRTDHPGQDIDLSLKASGSTYRELAGDLNGFVWLRGGERQIAANQLGFLFGDFLTEVFTTINPFAKKEPYQTLECDRIFFEVADGVIRTSPVIFLRTDKLNMTAVGAINLHTERIDIAIETSPRTGIGLSASDLVNPFIKIGGTLAKPGLTLNPTGTLIEGGAAVATMGLTIVAKSMYKRWLGPRKPCQKLTEEARKIRTERDPAKVPAD